MIKDSIQQDNATIINLMQLIIQSQNMQKNTKRVENAVIMGYDNIPYLVTQKTVKTTQSKNIENLNMKMNKI